MLLVSNICMVSMFYERNGFYFIVDDVVVTTTAGILPSLIIIIKWHRRDECHPAEYLRAAAYSLIVSVNVVSGSDVLSYRGNSLTTPFFLFCSIARAFVVNLLAANISTKSQRQQQRTTVIKWYIHRMCIADANSAPSRAEKKKRKRKEYKNTNNKNNKIS